MAARKKQNRAIESARADGVANARFYEADKKEPLAHGQKKTIKRSYSGGGLICDPVDNTQLFYEVLETDHLAVHEQ